MKNVRLIVVALLWSTASFAEELSLNEMMLALDAEVFDSFNKCEDEKELVRHTNYFDPNVEFYHDNGGVTWDRTKMIQNTKTNACGNFTRELVEGTFTAYSVKDFGAITKGVHRFCQSDTGKCEGKADFVMIWRNSDDRWQVTRVLSFGHREN